MWRWQQDFNYAHFEAALHKGEIYLIISVHLEGKIFFKREFIVSDTFF